MRTDYTETRELFADDTDNGIHRFGILHLVSRIVSVLLHPLLVPTWLTLVLLFIMHVIPAEPAKLWTLAGLITTFTLVLPLFGSYILYRTGFVKDQSMVERSDRILPMFFTAICFALPQIFFYEILRFSVELVVLLYSMTLCVVAAAITTVWYKISAHAISMGGVFALSLMVAIRLQDHIMLWPVLSSILASGILLSARLFLQVHTPLQVLSGFMLGLTIAGLCSYFLL